MAASKRMKFSLKIGLNLWILKESKADRNFKKQHILDKNLVALVGKIRCKVLRKYVKYTQNKSRKTAPSIPHICRIGFNEQPSNNNFLNMTTLKPPNFNF